MAGDEREVLGLIAESSRWLSPAESQALAGLEAMGQRSSQECTPEEQEKMHKRLFCTGR